MGEGKDDLQVCADFTCVEGFFCKFVDVLQRPNTFYGRLSEISKIKRNFLLIPFRKRMNQICKKDLLLL